MDDTVEKGYGGRQPSPSQTSEKEGYNLTIDSAETCTGEVRTAWNLKLRSWIVKMGAEERGIERVPSERRTNQHPRDMFTLFMSANVCMATLAFGTLGPGLFGLGWWDSFLCVLFFNLIGAIPGAFMATFGPKLGLRTLVVPRYSFGWWPAKLIAAINALNQIGWAMVNTIAGAEILYDVGQHRLPTSVAVLIIALLAIVVVMFGYKIVHLYERYSWMITLVCFCIIAGFGAKHFVNAPMGTGATEISNVLSFGTSIIGFQISWAPIAADFCVYMREDRKTWQVFAWTYHGLFWSQFFVELLGVGLMTAVAGSKAFSDAYDNTGVGGVVGQVFVGYGSGVRNFGYFIETLLAFSVLGVVVANLYATSLDIQITSEKLMVIPRLVWSLIAGAICLIAAIAGRNNLQAVMENFLNVIAYWLTPFLTIVWLEHIVWRRDYQYDVTAWNDPKKLPVGIAALVSFVVGTVLAVLCMSQKWWVGPIALKVGNPPFGTDISWELALGATVVLYVPLRWLERKHFGR
jgi:NCS1 nucleoside transporter family